MTKRKLLDANAIICFITNSVPNHAKKTAEILNKYACYVPVEVIAEVVYALRDRHKYTRRMISDRLKDFIHFQNNLVPDEDVVAYALQLFAASTFDFVDCLIDGYAKIKGYQVLTFDEALQKQLQEKSMS